ncbi:MAG: calcium-binding protein [Pseudomonadota bacterium]
MYHDATQPSLFWTGSALEIYAGRGSGVQTFELSGTTLSLAGTDNTVGADAYATLAGQGAVRYVEARHLDQLEAGIGTTTSGDLVFGSQSGLMSDALTLMALSHGGQTLYVSALFGQAGLSLLKRNSDTLDTLDAVGDTSSSYAQQITAMASWSSGSQTYVFVGSYGDGGISSYAVDGTDLEWRASFGREEGVAFNTPTALKVVDMGGQTYLLASDAGTSQLSVMAVSTAGGLTLTDSMMDDRTTRFDDVAVFDVIDVAGHVFVVAGGTDGGVTLLRLLPNGQLVHIDSLADTADLGLEGINSLSLTQVGSTIHAFVTSEDVSGVTHLTLETDVLGLVRTGGAGRDTLVGGSGNDQLWGGAGHDILQGRAGDDMLIAGAGRDTLEGGSGADIFVAGADAETIEVSDFEIGTDRIDVSAWPFLYSVAQLTVEPLGDGARILFGDRQLILRTADGTTLYEEDFIETDVFGLFRPPLPEPTSLFIEDDNGSNVLTGVSGDDSLMGNGGNDTIDGRGGADRLEGGADSDLIYGGNGTDTLYGDGGHDALNGGDGNDLLYGGTGADTLDGGLGNDTVFGDSSIDHLIGGAGADSLVGGTGADTLYGNDGDDTLFSNTGVDLLYGGAGNDYISSGNGVDIVYGEDGNDTIFGRTGWDTISGGAGHDSVYGSEGVDDIDGGSGNDWLSGGTGFDNLFGGSGNDSLYGNLGSDNLFGGSGNDSLYGATGNDLLEGGSGDDRLFANQGVDTLDGGAGSDLLQGGSLADTFVFDVGHDKDKITDFEVGVDTLHLSAALVDGLTDPDLILERFGNMAGGRVRMEFNDDDWIAIDGVDDYDAIAAAIKIF